MRNALFGATLLVALMLYFFASTAAAEAGTTGSLSGTVRDASSGNPVANARVVAAGTAQTASAVTNESGAFVFLSLQPDTYTVSVQKAGFDPSSTAGVTIFADQSTTLEFRVAKPLTQIARVRSRTSTDLVRPGQTVDSYSVEPALAQRVVTLGGGTSYDQAYAALATVPGVTIPPGQAGWSQTASVTIRGGTHREVGYEFDGVPVTVNLNGFSGTNLSSLGQQELQVYNGSAPPNAETQGLSGFINQVIRTGTYPASVTVDGALGTPYYHKTQVEFSGATRDRNFYYYVGLLGANQSLRAVDNYNGASFTGAYGTGLALLPCPAGSAAAASYVSCYDYATPGGFHVGPGGVVNAAPNYLTNAYEQDRENVVNLHLAVPHKRGLKDDLQLLYDNGIINSWTYSAQNDIDPAVLAVTGKPSFPNSYVYEGPVATALPANYASLVQPYFLPTAPHTLAGDLQIPADRRNQQQNQQSIEKVQYTHSFDDHSYLRAFTYAQYSTFLVEGAATTSFAIGTLPEYNLWTHTTGDALEYSNQLSGKDQLQAQASYTHSPGTEDFGLTVFTPPSAAFAVAVDSTNPNDGLCYSVAGAVAKPASCQSGDDQASFVTYGSAARLTGSNPVVPLNGSRCGGGPCRYYAVDQGFNGSYNTVALDTIGAGIYNSYKPTDRLSLDVGLKFNEYLYDGANTGGGARTFWFNAYNQDYCVNALPGNTPVSKATLGINVASACSAADTGGVSYVAPGLTNAPANYAFSEYQPRAGLTYQAGPNDVLRGDYGIFTQPTETTFEQINNKSQNLPSFLGSTFYKYGFTGPGHDIPPQISYNVDASWEHRFANTDIAFKATPFYRSTRNELTEFFIDPALQTTGGLAVGGLRTSGVEFQLRKGSFGRDGFAALLSYTYTTARAHYYALPGGGNVLSQVNDDIRTYNGYTSACAKAPANAECGPTNAADGSGKAAACFTPKGIPDATCAAGDIANPYWNAPLQSTLDPNGSYWPTDPVIATTSLGVNSYTVPHVAAVVLNYRKGPFSITPAFQLQAGQRYGAPESNAGIDPGLGCSALAGASVKGDGRYPYGAPAGAPYNALTCAGALDAIPDVYTGNFDAIGAFTAPAELLGGLTLSYDVTKKVTLSVSAANLINQCFGGSTEPWTGYATPHVCSYVNGEVSRVSAPTGNIYNPNSVRQAYGSLPYYPYLGPYTMGVVNPIAPVSLYANLAIKL